MFLLSFAVKRVKREENIFPWLTLLSIIGEKIPELYPFPTDRALYIYREKLVPNIVSAARVYE